MLEIFQQACDQVEFNAKHSLCPALEQLKYMNVAVLSKITAPENTPFLLCQLNT